MWEVYHEGCFNPTLVRLRLGSLRWAFAGMRFQSHAGSIEAGTPRTPRQGPSRFQSHAGSIEAGVPAGGTLRPWLGFNPTLVRLRRPTTAH